MKTIAVLCVGLIATATFCPPARAEGAAKGAPDYALTSSWMCRPEISDGPCQADLTAKVIDAKGNSSIETFTPAANPRIDCFYVYPTASADTTTYSDMTPGLAEKAYVAAQAARLGSVCRVFAPVYRQLTIPELKREMANGVPLTKLPLDPPYQDVLAAWQSYLKNDNKGRGVVLIGHSQGAILLKRLIVEQIDNKPVRMKLVAAYLGGNLDLTRSTFTNIPACASPGQTGCVVAWSDYLESDMAMPLFGVDKSPADLALCVNSASPSGGSSTLITYLLKPADAPAGDPPFVKYTGSVSGICEDRNGARDLRITITADPTGNLTKALHGSPGWGLHLFDLSLPQGNIVRMVTRQAEAWGGK